MSILKPINPNANEDAVRILNLLKKYTDDSTKSICGAFDHLYYRTDGNYNNYDCLSKKYGDLGLYSTYYLHRGDGTFDYEESNEKIIEHYKEGAVILVHNANEWADDMCAEIYENEEDRKDFIMNFDAENPNRNEKAYNFYLKCRESWADGLEALKNAGVTAMYRPFVEMNNKYFFGSFTESEEGIESFKRIWRQLVDYLINERNLDNILITYSPSSCANDGRSDLYFPGSDYVDVVAPTAYSMPWVHKDAPEEFYEKAWHYSRHAGLCDKPFGYAELGVDLNKDEPNKGKGEWRNLLDLLEKCPKMGFFCLWSGDCSPVAESGLHADEFMTMKNWAFLKDIK